MLLFDIGANIGNWTLANIGDNKIICVEASPTTFEKLIHNVQNKGNIIPLNYAVSDVSTDTVIFYESNSNILSTLDKKWLEDSRSRFGINSPFGGYVPHKEINVKTITLDKLITTYGIPDLLKIDVEGAENIVLRSLTSKAKLICFEWASEWNVETIECIDHLVKIGYNQFHVQNQDTYNYRPNEFEHTSSSIKDYLRSTTPMVEWGMIWSTYSPY